MQAPPLASSTYNDLLDMAAHRPKGGSDADSRVAEAVEFVEIRHSRCDVYMTPAVSESGSRNPIWSAIQQAWYKLRPTADIRRLLE